MGAATRSSIVLLVPLATALLACGASQAAGPVGEQPSVAVEVVAAVVESSAIETPAPQPERPPASPLPPSPAEAEGWRIVIPDIGVNAELVPVGLEPDGAMGAPEDPFVVGWFQHGPIPGQRGNVLLDGHVDWTNRQTGVPFAGVFWSLTKLEPGSRVSFVFGDMEYVYEVEEKKRYRWDDPEGASVLQPSDDSRVTLITCGGVFDRASRNYLARDVVIARRVTG